MFGQGSQEKGQLSKMRRQLDLRQEEREFEEGAQMKMFKAIGEEQN